MKFASLLCALTPMLAQQPALHEELVNGRKAYVMENKIVRAAVLPGGGHIGEFRFLEGGTGRKINPLRVTHYPTIDPQTYDPKKHDALYGKLSARWLLSGYMGHLLCFPAFGAPSSPEEVRNQFGDHGEAPIVEWKLMGSGVKDGVFELRYGADLPRSQYRVERTISMRAGEQVLVVEESVENKSQFDRPMNWVQHATFGAPYVEPGKSFFDVSATTGQVSDWVGTNSLAANTPVTWPKGLDRNRGTVNLRAMRPDARSNTYYALLMDKKRAESFFTMYHSAYPVMTGYLFPTADNPWLGDWQENGSNAATPWSGKAVARGIEFGTSPMPEGLRKSVERASLLGTPTYRWINGSQKLRTWWAIFLMDIPATYQGTADVRLEGTNVVITEANTGKKTVLGAATLAKVAARR